MSKLFGGPFVHQLNRRATLLKHVDNVDYDDDSDDDDDDADGKPIVGDHKVVSRHRKNTPLKVGSNSFHRDSELGQMLITCDKLSDQAPLMTSRFIYSCFSSA